MRPWGSAFTSPHLSLKGRQELACGNEVDDVCRQGTDKDLVISWLVMMKLQPNLEAFSASFTLGVGTWVYVNDPGIEPVALASPALAGIFFTTALPGKSMLYTLLLTFSFPLNFSEVEFSNFSESLQ